MLATNDDVQSEDSGETQVLKAGDIVQISDCQGRSVFQVTNNTAGVIQHAAGKPNNGLPGNASDDIGYAFTDAAELLPVQSVVYYLGSEEDGDPVETSLYRRVSGSTEADELVEGVESMQFRFGQTVGGTIQYRRADEVTDWRAVQTVRIALLVRSTTQYGTDVDTTTYDLLGTPVLAPGDRHLRQVFTTTVGIRNVAN
jgi:type IV pilus assembly protein PilW